MNPVTHKGLVEERKRGDNGATAWVRDFVFGVYEGGVRQEAGTRLCGDRDIILCRKMG